MADAEAFRAALRRIRAGDQQAAAELVQRYEPLIRREVRLKLEDARLRRAFDSMDIVQSVLASFFCRAAAGAFDLESPEHLRGLLIRMTLNKLASAARKQYRHRRDARRITDDDAALKAAIANEPAPGDAIADAEMLNVIRRQLTAEECTIAMLRADCYSWEEIAARVGGKPQARRMQLTRAVARAARELGLAKLYD